MRRSSDVACPYCEGEPRTMEFVKFLPYRTEPIPVGARVVWKCYVCEEILIFPKDYGAPAARHDEYMEAYNRWWNQSRRGNPPPYPSNWFHEERFDAWVEKRRAKEAKKPKGKPKKSRRRGRKKKSKRRQSRGRAS